MDAGAFGARLTPEDAYRFARGEEVASSTAGPARLARPLDFLVVADHSDNMGFFPALFAGNPDILAELCTQKGDRVVVGFAAESHDVHESARRKLARKGCDLIVANDVGAPDTGFRHDTNAVTMFSPGAEPVVVPLADKRTIAAAVFDRVVRIRDTR